jgi:acetolactate synthase-1/2/3 large subunit
MIAITGNVPSGLLGRDSFQEVDIAGVTMPVTKHNYIAKDIERLADTLREAFQVAISGRPGPVLVDIPKDVQIATAEYEVKLKQQPRPDRQANEEDIEQALAVLKEAKRPYIYCGGGIVLSDASEELQRLAELIDAPIGSSMMGLSSVPSSIPGF